jgi:DNA-binding NarL/FixJ family response regulator
MTSVPIRVLVADDTDAMRQAICELLSHESAVNVIGEARSYAELLRLVNEDVPDVVLMDLYMPDEGRFNVTLVRSQLRSTRLLAMSIWDNEESVRLSESYGALRLLNKANLVSVLVPAIEECVQGRRKTQHA